MKINEIIEGKISDIAFGGKGVLRHKECVIFIPYTAIGDTIQCKITKIKTNFAEAEILKIIDSSHLRRNPECPYFRKCGGCQFQHLEYSSQLQVKEKILRDAFGRIGKIPNTAIEKIIPSPVEWFYRRHISLHFSINPVCTLGFIGTDNQNIVEIDECPLFEKNEVIYKVKEIIKKIKTSTQIKGKVTIAKAKENCYVLHFHFAHLPEHFLKFMQQTLKDNLFQGIIASSKNKRVSVGNTELSFFIDSYHFTYSPIAFIQNHPEQSAMIYRKICQKVEKAKVEKVLDLYCGIGITGTMISAMGVSMGVSLIGVESSEEAIQLAQLNAKRNKVEAKYIRADVAEVIDQLLIEEKPEMILLNPPREGLSPKVVKAILSNPPEQILYTSCMPATLARDLKILMQRYEMIECQPFDMFPQTTHLETLVHLCRRHEFCNSLYTQNML